MKLPLYITLLFTMFSMSNVRAHTESENSKNSQKNVSHCVLLPYYYLNIDLTSYHCHKNTFFKNRYFLSSNIDFDIALFVYKKRYLMLWEFDFSTGMGQTPGNIIFDPMDVNFGISPIFEYRNQEYYIFRIGLEHKCFHEIDKKDYTTIYWNKLFFGFGSYNLRIGEYWKTLHAKSMQLWQFNERISWYLCYGVFIKEFFDIISPSALNGNHNDIHNFLLETRFALFQYYSWLWNIKTETLVGTHRRKWYIQKIYWKQMIGLECHLGQGEQRSMIFLQFILDDLPTYQGIPRLSKDKLLEIGFAFYL